MELLGILGLTVQIAVVGTAINLPLALGVSWLIVKRRIPGRLVFDALVSLPLAVPPVVVGYALLLLLGNRGPIGGLLQDALGVELVFTWFAAALAAAIVSFPLMARAVMVAMGGVDEHLEMAARSLGAGAVRVFFTITVPLAYRGILAGVLLGFVRAISEFGATIIVAGNIPGKTQTLPLAIYSEVLLGDDTMAIRLIAVSVGLAVVTLLAHNWLLDRAAKNRL
ncbi:MAG: molybdate ABC transporter permease subunit [Chloroflexi bacterium]|nr:molybdate ABC transporter permease subunit [Chloroflexota bacterium]